MRRRMLIAIAIVWIMCLFSQRSSAQNQDFFCSYDPAFVYTRCGGGIGCSGYVSVPQFAEFDDGFYWSQVKQACSGGYGCYVMSYTTSYQIYCYYNELRGKETQDQLAKLALDRNVIIADCKGHYRQYRAAQPSVESTLRDGDMLRDVLR